MKAHTQMHKKKKKQRALDTFHTDWKLIVPMKCVYFPDPSILHDPLMVLVGPTGFTLVQIGSKEAKAYAKICYKFTLCWPTNK